MTSGRRELKQRMSTACGQQETNLCRFGKAARLSLWWLSGLGVISGCGSDSPFEYVPIQGKVTYEDGSLIPASFELRFQALAPPIGTAHPRPAMAEVKSDGTFDEVTSYKYGDGLVPGKHKVVIAYATDATGRSLVPDEYTTVMTTPLEIDTAEAPLEIKVPKPKPARSK
jgi:hypothetical protein